MSAALAAVAAWVAFQAEARFALLAHARRDPFNAGLIFTGVCLMLSLFAYIGSRGQRFLTRVVFRTGCFEVAGNCRKGAGRKRAFFVTSSVAERFFGPQIAGVGTTPGAISVFRIDHDYSNQSDRPLPGEHIRFHVHIGSRPGYRRG